MAEWSKETQKNMQRLYHEEGLTVKQIAKMYKISETTARRWMDDDYIPQKYLTAQKVVIKKEKKAKGGYTKAQIEKTRKRFEVGQIIRFSSQKSCGDSEEKTTNGVARKGKIISVKNPYFCVVEILGSGMKESVMWSDLAK